MRKKLLPIIAISIMMIFSACSNEELLPEIGRTISISASMPKDIPNTRVSLEQNGKNIELKWVVGDVVELAFIQGATIVKSEAEVTSISTDGKVAQFDNLSIPNEIQSGLFDLYGVYGGGGVSTNDPTLAILPVNSEDANSLGNVENRKDVMLYFGLEGFDINNPPTSDITFQHLGSLFSITVRNTGNSILNFQEAQLEGIGGDNMWAYNAGAGGKTFNLVTEEFQFTETARNFISFKSETILQPLVGEMTFWGWYPPLTEKNWPELQLKLIDENTVDKISENTKEARTTPTAVGKSYHFYALWDGVNLNFTNDLFEVPVQP